MSAVSALPPARPTVRHRLRARRARARAGVVLRGTPLLGRGIVLDLDPQATLELGDGCVLLDGCRVHARGAACVRIGDRALLGERCVLLAHDRVEVGPAAILGDGAVLVDFAHADDDVERPIRAQPLRTAPVLVGAGARIGAGAVVGRGARIAPGAVVGANSVVGQDPPAPPPVADGAGTGGR